MDLIKELTKSQLKEMPAVQVGDTVKVHVKVKEGARERIQVFQGDVIRRQGKSSRETFTVRKVSFSIGVERTFPVKSSRETFTVRKVSFSIGVERTFPVHSPKIEKIEVTRRGKVRRAKLYYLRDKVGKAAKIKEASRN